jgi:uncharacterized protein
MNIPERTCIGCYQKSTKANLVKLVLSDEAIIIDNESTKPGRGAYLHKNSECLLIAAKRNNFSRAFKASISPHIINNFKNEFSEWLMNKKS